MRVRGSYSPPPYEIEKGGDAAILRFYENAEEVNEADESGGAAFVGYEFDRYTIIRPYDAGLEARVSRDAGGWAELAKREERDRTEAEVRAERAKLIAETDWTALTDVPLAPAEREAYRAYRQALRDVDGKHVPAFPYGVSWPAKPQADREGAAE